MAKHRTDICRYVSPFCSPATMPRAMAQRLLAADLSLWAALREVDSTAGAQAPYIEG